jgi:hypothetical protein
MDTNVLMQRASSCATSRGHWSMSELCERFGVTKHARLPRLRGEARPPSS